MRTNVLFPARYFGISCGFLFANDVGIPHAFCPWKHLTWFLETKLYLYLGSKNKISYSYFFFHKNYEVF